MLAHVDHRVEECRALLRELASHRDDGDEERDRARRQTPVLLSELARLRVVASLADRGASTWAATGYVSTDRLRPSLHGPAAASLVAAAKDGDLVACQEVVERCLPLIAAVARIYRRSGALDRMELMQAGIAGLLAAVQRFDPKRGTPFWAYAGWWVRQSMQHLVAELSGPVVLSDRAFRQLARVRDARRVHEQFRGANPSAHDLATSVGTTQEEVERLLAAERTPRALDEPSDGDGDGPRLRPLADPESEAPYERVLQEAENDDVRAALESLDERERTIVRDRYGLGCEPHTLREIASGLGVTAERVRQIERQALDLLRDAAETQLPD